MPLPSPFLPEPAFTHGQRPRAAVLLCNLGTPDAPTPAALRRYLAEFLSDRRVVEIPRALWLLILHGIILRTRPAKSAAKYATVWTAEGSPLKVWTSRQAELLQKELSARGSELLVRYAMRYGQPSMAHQLNALKAEGVTRVLILPAYPQYSGTTTASVLDAVFDWGKTVRALPELRMINRYHDDAGYVQALAAQVETFWATKGRPDLLLMSFHGVPRRTLELGDPYHCECHKTARLLATRLGLESHQYKVTFQSRFGKARWLEPYTEPTLRQMGQAGVARVDVICPGFTSDCLETLEEIAVEARHAFVESGGREFHYIPCLNDNLEWIQAMAALVQTHTQGWPEGLDATVLEQQQARATALGAPR